MVLIAALTGLLVWGCTRSPGIDTAAAADDVPAYTGPQAPSHHHQLRRNGAWLVDAQGRAVILHGVNAVWKQAPYVAPDSVDGFTAADADWLAAHGFNAVRLGVLFAGVMPQPHMVDSSYLDRIDRVVQLLAARGIYVLLDFHQDLYNERYHGEGFPDWATQPSRFDTLAQAGFPLNYFTPPASGAFDRLWDNAGGLQDDYRSAWMAVTARWQNQDHLMGYELINEPWPGGNWPRCAGPRGCAHFERDKLQPMYEKVLAGIRSVDHDNIVWIEPQILFDFGVASHLGGRGIADGQLGLSFHDYCLPETLLQAFGLKKLPACQPLERRVFSNARATSRRLGSASLMTEFGASDDLPDTARLVGYADDNLTGWMVWSYKNWGDPTTQAQGSGAQSLFRRDDDFGSVKQAKLEVLERPYPQAVAGTPLAYHFDAQSKAFSLEYSTTLPGGSSGAALETEVYVPALHYPNGYSVQVQGGRVVSVENAALLRIVAAAGAERVSLSLAAK
ncbi:MAG: cellulase family glycosylhydrolase [Nevskia sp.]|nr:cellulase family glycosylhydrolase [Nevskia sp.]